MNESFETKKPIDKYIEGAMRNNAEFLAEISEAETLENLARVVSDYSFVDEAGESIVFEIIENGADEVDARTSSLEELLGQMYAVANTPDLLKQDIIEMVEFGAVAQALIKILGK